MLAHIVKPEVVDGKRGRSLQLFVRKQTNGCLGTKCKLEVEQNTCWRLKQTTKKTL